MNSQDWGVLARVGRGGIPKQTASQYNWSQSFLRKRKRHGDRETETEAGTDRQTETETKTERQTQTQRDREKTLRWEVTVKEETVLKPRSYKFKMQRTAPRPSSEASMSHRSQPHTSVGAAIHTRLLKLIV